MAMQTTYTGSAHSGVDTTATVDLIIPIWGEAASVGSALASLVENTPDARFIFLNNGCERETEQLVEAVAEHLDDRALFISFERNLGHVRAVNAGLARSDASLRVVLHCTTRVRPGWLAGLVAAAAAEDVGMVVPGSLLQADEKVAAGDGVAERDHGSFSAMLVKGALYDRIGGFDEELWDEEWCLRDYSRRAWQAGFRTGVAPRVVVDLLPIKLYGSLTARQMRQGDGKVRYEERWGLERQHCLYVPADTRSETVSAVAELALQAARQGHGCTILAHSRLFKGLREAGWTVRHDRLRIIRLPALFPERAARRRAGDLAVRFPSVEFVTNPDGIAVPGQDRGLDFAAFAAGIRENQAIRFAGTTAVQG